MYSSTHFFPCLTCPALAAHPVPSVSCTIERRRSKGVEDIVVQSAKGRGREVRGIKIEGRRRRRRRRRRRVTGRDSNMELAEIAYLEPPEGDSQPHVKPHEALMREKETLRYRWELWKGDAKFLCNGRIMLGVHYRQLLTTLILTLFTWLIFQYFSWVFMDSENNRHVSIAGFIFLFLQVTFLLITSLTEPGFVPRSSNHHLVETPAVDFALLEYCRICDILKYPRTKHCK